MADTLRVTFDNGKTLEAPLGAWVMGILHTLSEVELQQVAKNVDALNRDPRAIRRAGSIVLPH